MSTTYVLLQDSLEVTEHSDKFDIDAYSDDIYKDSITVCDLSLDELKEISKKLLQVISYFDLEGEA